MNSPPSKNEVPFVTYLKKLGQNENRGALAALRCGLGRPPGSAPEMHRYVMPFLSLGPWTWRNECHYVVAALFALHPESAAHGNMGDTLHAIHAATRSESIEQRFVALLKCHRDDLFDHLRHAISLARGKSVPIHWEQLFKDICYWESENRRVHRNWSQGFWSEKATPEKLTETADSGE